MKRQLAQAGMMLALGLGLTAAANATILVSTVGVLGDANAVFEQQFTYNPATMGTQLIIQTFGWGGTSNQPGGANAACGETINIDGVGDQRECPSGDAAAAWLLPRV